MLNYKERLNAAESIYKQGLKNVKNNPVPKEQKYLPGERVRIKSNLGSTMSHFPSGRLATVKYTYAQAYWGNDVKSYCLDVDDIGEVSWYPENRIRRI